MDFYGVNMTGPFVVQKVAAVPSRFVVSEDRGRIIRVENSNGGDQFWVGVGDIDNLSTANQTGRWWRQINLEAIDPSQLQTTVRLREIYNYSAGTTASPVDVVIPNNGTYTVDGESLEVYLNRVRLLGTEYTEVSENVVRFPTGLVTGDTIEFFERSGFVDISDINSQNIQDLTDSFLEEHNNDGTHKTTSSAVPCGTIIAFPTENVPAGYSICDGSLLSTSTYSNLFSVLGYRYGGGGTTFRVPDYRGYFLRGHAGTSSVDPDSADRTNRGDGTTGNNVGTKQSDGYKLHKHGIRLGHESGGTHDATGFPQVDHTGPFITHSEEQPDLSYTYGNGVGNPLDSSGGNETRPKNIYVVYCIKNS